ncbi:MAG: helix-turn-helix domain-containing protein [Kiritimatiellae bacterium]|nr:helix-turn-helix domain-containing protein [Kiritimatiellia bacterium]
MRFPAPLEIRVLTVNRSILSTRWGLTNTCDPYTRVYYIENGRGWLRERGQSLELTPGRLYLIPAFTEASFGCYCEITIFWTHLVVREGYGPDFPGRRPCVMTRRAQRRRILPMMRRLERVFRTVEARPDRAWETTGLVLQLLSHFLVEADTAGPAVREELAARFSRVVGHIERHYAEPLPVPELARMAALEEAYFSTLFSRLYGMAPHRYVLWKRIAACQDLLSRTDLTLAAIASRTGFYDAYHLSKTFKRLTGATPGQFRHRQPHLEP